MDGSKDYGITSSGDTDPVLPFLHLLAREYIRRDGIPNNLLADSPRRVSSFLGIGFVFVRKRHWWILCIDLSRV